MTIIDATTVSTSVEVDAPIARAFHVFTAEIGTWWDDDKHILAADVAETVFEPFVGGSIIDRGVDGNECRWARVLAYEPPRRVCFSWDITTRWQIETDPTMASEVEIVFSELSPERTLVVLTHRHWTGTARGGRACATQSTTAGACVRSVSGSRTRTASPAGRSLF
jgi:uncharacterized protein YndB with AHSA1/START domain